MTTRFRGVQVAGFLLIQLVGSTSISLSQSLSNAGQALAPKEIQDAIDFAREKRVEGYRLGGLPFGYVHTPFIRVALAAKAAFNLRKSFTQADVTPDMTEPLVYVQAFEYARGFGANNSAQNIVVLSRPNSETIQPISMGAELFRQLSTSAGVNPGALSWLQHPVSRGGYIGGTGLVASFPLSAFADGNEIILIYVEGSSGRPRTEERKFKIDTKKWR